MCCTRLAENTGRKKVAKNRHLGTISQLCQAISSQLRHVSTIEKNLLSTNMSSTCPHNMVNFGPLMAEIVSLVWGTPKISTGFASWQRCCMACSSGHQPNFTALNTGRHLCSAERPSRWALAHISSFRYVLWNFAPPPRKKTSAKHQRSNFVMIFIIYGLGTGLVSAS